MMSQLLLGASKKQTGSTLDMVDPFGDGSGVALYKFDGDATDSSGTYHGAAAGVTYSAGKLGQCAVFNGTHTYDGFTEDTITNVSFINLGAKAPELFSEYSGKPRTYSAWVALSSSTDAFVLNYGNLDNQTSPYYFNISFTPTLFHVRTQSYQPGNTFTGKETNTYHGTIINYGTFYHIAFVFPSDSTGIIKFYINGDFVGQAAHTVWSSLSSSYDVWLQKFTGNAANGYAPHYVGCKIDSLRVFNRVLNSAEIISLYEEGGDTYVPYVPPQGFFNDGTEVAYYAFDGDATDSTGNNDGTATNITYVTGRFGQCAVFNGSSSNVKITQNAYSSNAFSVSCWVKFNALGLDQRFVVCNSNTYSKYFRINIRTDNKISAFYGTSNSAIIISPSTYTTGVFYHIAMSAIQGSNLSLYINGVLIQSIANGGTGYVANLASEFGAWVGSGRGGVSEILNGSIDQLRIFNRALTQEEVTALYNEGV